VDFYDLVPSLLQPRERRENLLTATGTARLWPPTETMRDERDRQDPVKDVSALLQAWRDGDGASRDELLVVVYEELRRRAAAQLRRERGRNTLQPTGLVHEVYLRFIKQDRAGFQDRAQFFGVAAHMMRRILVDRARARNMAKRSGRWARVTLDEAIAQGAGRDVDVLDLDRALTELAVFDPRKSQVAELRFFAGLSLAETSHVVNLSVATVEREWQAARAWLYARLTATDRVTPRAAKPRQPR
jgi:RNA polymerase sigma factor (TIGR02999 family)